MSTTNSAAAASSNQQPPRTLAQHFAVAPATLTALEANPNQLVSETDQDTLAILQETLQVNSLVPSSTGRRRNNGRPRESTGARAPPAPRRLQRREGPRPASVAELNIARRPQGAVFEVEPIEPPVRTRVTMSNADAMALAGELDHDDTLQRHSAQEPVFERWDRVEDRRRISSGSGSEEEQRPQDALTYEGLMAAESVGLSFREEARWGMR